MEVKEYRDWDYLILRNGEIGMASEPNFCYSEIKPIVILMYHNYQDSIAGIFEYIRNKEDLEAAHLNDPDINNYLIDPQNNKRPSNKIVITFDDAYLDFYTNAICAVIKYGIKVTLCVPTGDIHEIKNREPCWTNNKGPLMSWKQLKELRSNKQLNALLEFIPHSVTHNDYDKIERDCIESEIIQKKFDYEVRESKKILCTQLNLDEGKLNFYCLPGGRGEGKEEVNEILKKYYLGALRADSKEQKWNRFKIPRCEASKVSDLERFLEGSFYCE